MIRESMKFKGESDLIAWKKRNINMGKNSSSVEEGIIDNGKLKKY